MSAKFAQTLTVGLNVFVIVGLVISVILAGVVTKQSYDTALLLLNTKELAQELRQSSDDLTRFIRTYTVTGNASYWDFFNEVIHIRNGDAPLPIEPSRNYWDLRISSGVPPRGFQAPRALLDRMRDADFTSREMELLEEAKRQSDALIDLEDVAYHAMQGMYRPTTPGLPPDVARQFSVRAEPNQTLARNLVHGNAYHIWKGKIMRPIDDFSATSAQRVLDSIEESFRFGTALIGVLSLMLTLLISLLVVYFCKVAKDSQTAQLLSTVLPQRVVDSVTVSQFSQLREVAHRHSVVVKDSPRLSKAEGRKQAIQRAFPVLYSEFLPVCWVGFTDIVNFTLMCRNTSCKEVISVLNEIFSLFDVSAAHHRVEKIKTIGDAFMCAKLSTSELSSSVAVDNFSIRTRVADDGIDIVMFLCHTIELAQIVMRPVEIHGDDGSSQSAADMMQIRAGLHAGPVASGIVGFERPLYDLFGDTVNTAARLEASGKADCIQVMDSTLSLFDDHVTDLDLADGQQVNLKGIGTCHTRYITGCKQYHSNESKGYRKAIISHTQ